MGSLVVVAVAELIDQVLQSGQGVGLVGLSGEPFLEGLLEAFDFPAGGGVVGSGVLLDDPGGDQVGLEGVAAVSSASEPGGVDHAVVGQH